MIAVLDYHLVASGGMDAIKTIRAAIQSGCKVRIGVERAERRAAGTRIASMGIYAEFVEPAPCNIVVDGKGYATPYRARGIVDWDWIRALLTATRNQPRQQFRAACMGKIDPVFA